MDVRGWIELPCVATLVFAGLACIETTPPVPFDAGRPCEADSDCDDGLYCTGVEVCLDDGRCVEATRGPCDDRLACTVDACIEATRSCEATPIDADGDGHPPLTCVDADGAPLGDDCDDGDRQQFPGNPELCNPHDEDCDPDTLGGLDADGDGHLAAECCSDFGESRGRCGTDCDDSDPTIARLQPELCDGKDNDCDQRLDEEVICDGP